MDGSRREMNCIASRTRRRWDEYFNILHNEFKRKNVESGGVSGSDKRDIHECEPKIMDADRLDFVVGSEKGCDEKIDNVAMLKAADDCGCIGISKIDTDDKDACKIVEKLVSDEDGSAGLLKKDEYVDSDGIDILSIENEDDRIEMLKAGGEEEDGYENGVECSRGNAQTAPLDGEEICHSSSVYSGTEDLDVSVDVQVSESESTSEYEDEEDESSSDESNDGSGGELCSGLEEKKSDKVHTKRVDLRIESDNEPEKYAKGDEGDQLIKLSWIKNGRISPEKQNGGELERGEWEKKTKLLSVEQSARKKRKGADEEEPISVSKSQRKEPELRSCSSPVPFESPSTMDDEQESLNDVSNFFSTKLLSVEQSARKKRKGAEEEEPILVSKSQRKEPELRSCSSLPFESPSTMDDEQESLNDVSNFFSTKLLSVEQSARKKRNGAEEEEPISVSNSQRKEPELRSCSSLPFESPSTMDDEQESLNDVSNFFSTPVVKTKLEKLMFSSKKSRSARDIDLIKILVDSINSVKQKQYTIDETALAENSLPLKFKFEDEVVPPPEKSEWEKCIDSMFSGLELGLHESETNCSDFSKMENKDLKTTKKIDDSPAASCRRGDHQAVLDEQIGIVCEFCNTVIMDIKYILPPFLTPTRDRRKRETYDDESPSSYFGDIKFQGSTSSATDSTNFTYGTVWDLIPGVKRELYPHQREGFEFLWKNLAGGIIIEKLNKSLADDARGCIISHAPGTGKTRLTIVFLQTYLKMYPTCSPMIIAPRGMLLTWEAEFRKWNFNIAFHNLNKKRLSGKENAVATGLLEQIGCGALSRDCIRLLKLYSWATGGSILGISYPLFEKLTGRNGKRLHHGKIREVLLQRSGLVVLDEGHTPRNDNSKIWKVLKNVSTQRRIILSGTPFQNSLQELCNTVCVANPKFANQIGHRRYGRLTSSSDTNRDEAMKMKALLAPFIHVYKGTILEESLPGLRHTLVFLHPTESQKILLQEAWKEDVFLRRLRMISLISVHPSAAMKDGNKLNINEGVKTRFLMKLIQFSVALGERVLVFSQFIDSLVFIKQQLLSNFSWNVGREVLYMDGQLDDKTRQDSISSFNDDTSEAKVLLASVKACSEGINLIGASRVVLLDTLWNPSVEKQAICRAYRLGQKKVVHVYRLFTSGVEVRLGQYPCQLHKEQVSRWLFSRGEEGCLSENSAAASVDRVLEAMLNLKNFKHIFDKVLFQPKESDIIKIFR